MNTYRLLQIGKVHIHPFDFINDRFPVFLYDSIRPSFHANDKFIILLIPAKGDFCPVRGFHLFLYFSVYFTAL